LPRGAATFWPSFVFAAAGAGWALLDVRGQNGILRRRRAARSPKRPRGEDVSTEDLRVALQRYRSFFQRLLSA
jgi:hypothetical protein